MRWGVWCLVSERGGRPGVSRRVWCAVPFNASRDSLSHREISDKIDLCSSESEGTRHGGKGVEAKKREVTHRKKKIERSFRRAPQKLNNNNERKEGRVKASERRQKVTEEKGRCVDQKAKNSPLETYESRLTFASD